jgi:hypothetical protein
VRRLLRPSFNTISVLVIVEFVVVVCKVLFPHPTRIALTVNGSRTVQHSNSAAIVGHDNFRAVGREGSVEIPANHSEVTMVNRAEINCVFMFEYTFAFLEIPYLDESISPA